MFIKLLFFILIIMTIFASVIFINNVNIVKIIKNVQAKCHAVIKRE